MQKINLKEIAKKETVLSELMTGEKLESKDVDGQTLTVNAADIVSYTQQKIVNNAVADVTTSYAIVTFVEHPGKFYCGGAVLTKIVNAWLNACGSKEALAENLKDGVKLSFEMGKSSGGNDCMKVEVL